MSRKSRAEAALCQALPGAFLIAPLILPDIFVRLKRLPPIPAGAGGRRARGEGPRAGHLWRGAGVISPHRLQDGCCGPRRVIGA